MTDATIDPDIPPAERELLSVIDGLKAKRARLDTNDAERHLLQMAIYEYSQQVIHMRRQRASGRNHVTTEGASGYPPNL